MVTSIPYFFLFPGFVLVFYFVLKVEEHIGNEKYSMGDFFRGRKNGLIECDHREGSKYLQRVETNTNSTVSLGLEVAG